MYSGTLFTRLTPAPFDCWPGEASGDMSSSGTLPMAYSFHTQ
jgi:hypothetical protein